MADNTFYETDARGDRRPEKADPRGVSPRQSALPTDGPRLHRRRRSANPLGVDPRIIPKGWSYNWKAEDIYGMPLTEHKIDIRENHWRAVPASRHPELAIAGAPDIRRSGTVLMERPDYLTEEAIMEDIDEAMKPLRQKEELMYGTPAGQMTRDHPSVRGKTFINQRYAPGDPVPDDGSSAEP